jgi:6-phospho-3-hexuloisomerase
MNKIEVNDCEEVLLSMKLIIENIKEVIDKLDREAIKAMLQKTIDGNQVFVMGAGRSGLVAKAFAMRLMQLGLSVYVVGETTTPAVLPQDVVIAISGSGETRTVADLGKLAKDIGSTLITITSKKDSALGRISDIAVIIPSKTKNDPNEADYLERHMRGDYKKMPTLGTSFEITALVFLDSVIGQLIMLTGTSEAELKSRGTNIE